MGHGHTLPGIFLKLPGPGFKLWAATWDPAPSAQHLALCFGLASHYSTLNRMWNLPEEYYVFWNWSINKLMIDLFPLPLYNCSEESNNQN